MRATVTIEGLWHMAAGRGGKCLSKRYVNATTKLEWKCASGHRWKTLPQIIRGGSWCPTCAPAARRQHFLDAADKLAKQSGGRCISAKYRQPCPDCATEAPASRARYHAHTGISRRQPLGYAARAIGTVVVDDHDLVGDRLLIEHLRELADRGLEVSLFVVRRNHDGQQH